MSTRIPSGVESAAPVVASLERCLSWLECDLMSFFRPCQSSSSTLWLTRPMTSMITPDAHCHLVLLR